MTLFFTEYHFLRMPFPLCPFLSPAHLTSGNNRKIEEDSRTVIGLLSHTEARRFSMRMMTTVTSYEIGRTLQLCACPLADHIISVPLLSIDRKASSAYYHLKSFLNLIILFNII